MYVMFIDETGDHSLTKIDPQYPVFCLVGCIFEYDYYQNNANKIINKAKRKHFLTEAIVFHSYEIRKQLGVFNILRDTQKRERFVADINDMMTELDFTIIASCIKKDKLNNWYVDPGDPYDLSLTFLLERFQKFLTEKGETGYISVESRGQKPDTDLLTVFDSCKNSGTEYCKAEMFQKHITKIEFITKSKNENGHQIADLVAWPTAKFCLDGRKSNPAFDIIKDKFRRRGRTVKGYGYKEFPA